MADDTDGAQQAEKPRYNLIDEPWIPVLAGRHVRELGIRDTLIQAGRIAEIQDSSPLVVAALHRFLLAVCTGRWRADGWPTGQGVVQAGLAGGEN